MPHAFLRLSRALTILSLLWTLPAQAGTLDNARFTTLDGKPASLKALRGKRVLLNFWATWCGPCRREMPLLDSFSRSGRARGIETVGIALDDGTHVRDFLKKTPVHYPIWIGGDDSMDLLPALGNGGIVVPFTVLLDRQGKAVARWTGPLQEADLKRALDAHP